MRLLFKVSAFLAFACGMASPSFADFVLVADWNGTVSKYDTSGAYVGQFATGVTDASGITHDSSGNVYIASFGGNSISKFSSSGTLIGTLPAVLSHPLGIEIGPDGLMYVTNHAANNTIRLAADGNIDMGFAALVSTGGGTIHDLTFKKNGDGSFELLTLMDQGQIDQYHNGVGTPVTGNTGIGGDQGITFGPNGNLYVSGNLGVRSAATVPGPYSSFTSGSGATLGTTPGQPLWLPNGDFISADYDNHRVARFNSSGVYQNDLTAPSGGFVMPWGTDLVIVPEPSTLTLLACGLFGLLAYAWRKRK